MSAEEGPVTAPADALNMSAEDRPGTASAASMWPCNYDEDAFAKGDATLIFALMDRDVSGYLDCKEMLKARNLMLSAFVGTMNSDMVDGLLNCSDDNNDGKVNEIEWHDFLRSIYEVLGRKKYLDGVKRWKSNLYGALKEEEEEKKQQEEEKKKTKKKGKKAMSEEKAATKIQASFRGHKARAEVKKKKAKAQHQGAHDLEAVEAARAGGRHLITVISEDATSGNRADFYFDGDEIEFSRQDGDYGRGVQMVILDSNTQSVSSKSCYDVGGSNGRAERKRFAKDLEELEEGFYVLLAVKGQGLKDLDVKSVNALRGVGATYDGLGKEETGYALIGCKGYVAVAERHGRKAEAEAAVSFAKERKGNKLETAG